jgi:hypothetical protein
MIAKRDNKHRAVELLKSIFENNFYSQDSVHDKKICHARAGGQPSIKIIRYPNQSTEDWFAR